MIIDLERTLKEKEEGFRKGYWKVERKSSIRKDRNESRVTFSLQVFREKPPKNFKVNKEVVPLNKNLSRCIKISAVCSLKALRYINKYLLTCRELDFGEISGIFKKIWVEKVQDLCYLEVSRNNAMGSYSLHP